MPDSIVVDVNTDRVITPPHDADLKEEIFTSRGHLHFLWKRKIREASQKLMSRKITTMEQWDAFFAVWDEIYSQVPNVRYPFIYVTDFNIYMNWSFVEFPNLLMSIHFDMNGKVKWVANTKATPGTTRLNDGFIASDGVLDPPYLSEFFLDLMKELQQTFAGTTGGASSE